MSAEWGTLALPVNDADGMQVLQAQNDLGGVETDTLRPQLLRQPSPKQWTGNGQASLVGSEMVLQIAARHDGDHQAERCGCRVRIRQLNDKLRAGDSKVDVLAVQTGLDTRSR